MNLHNLLNEVSYCFFLLLLTSSQPDRLTSIHALQKEGSLEAMSSKIKEMESLRISEQEVKECREGVCFGHTHTEPFLFVCAGTW